MINLTDWEAKKPKITDNMILFVSREYKSRILFHLYHIKICIIRYEIMPYIKKLGFPYFPLGIDSLTIINRNIPPVKLRNEPSNTSERLKKLGSMEPITGKRNRNNSDFFASVARKGNLRESLDGFSVADLWLPVRDKLLSIECITTGMNNNIAAKRLLEARTANKMPITR